MKNNLARQPNEIQDRLTATNGTTENIHTSSQSSVSERTS